MLLTTNRVSCLDTAFKSPTHLNIEYPNLNAASRRSIWETFIRQQSEKSTALHVSISDTELDRLARMDLNGREINNVIKAARLLAARHQVPLKVAHVQTVLRIQNRQDVMVGTALNTD
jgi:SpoVK/Ycf46/Vps4 family AAA+-type ATPase